MGKACYYVYAWAVFVGKVNDQSCKFSVLFMRCWLASRGNGMGSVCAVDLTGLTGVFDCFCIWIFLKIGVPPNHPF